MPADCTSPTPMPMRQKKQLISPILPTVVGLVLFFVLSSAPAAWSGAIGTVPRETPTRVATVVVSPTATVAPPLSPTSLPAPTATASATAAPTLPAGQPTTTAAPTLPAGQPTTTVAATAAATAAPTSPTMTPLSASPTIPPTVRTPTVIATVAPQTPLAPPTPVSPAAMPPARPTTVAALDGGVCAEAPNAPLTLRWPDGQAVLDIPAGSLSEAVCIFLDLVDLAALPAAPVGFQLSDPAARIRVTDTGGNALAGFSFAAPAILTLSPSGAATQTDLALLEVAVLSPASTDWVILQAERDPQRGVITAHPRQPGVYALLLRLGAAAETEPKGGGALSGQFAAALGFAVVVVVILALLFAWRRRRQA